MKSKAKQDKLLTAINDLLTEFNTNEGEFDLQKSNLAPTGLELEQVNGQIAIENGKIVISPPKTGGEWPVISAGNNVIIKINGKAISEPTVVNMEQKVEILPRHQESQSKFSIELSLDEVEVFLETVFIPGKRYVIVEKEFKNFQTVEADLSSEIKPEPIPMEEVLEQLKNMGIVVDLDYAAIINSCSSLKYSKTVVARGIKMVPCIDGWVQYLFAEEERICNSPTEEGAAIDFFDKGEINSVESGELLAVLHPPVLGKPGLTATGQTIWPSTPKEADICIGEGVELVQNGQAAVAKVSGRPVTKGSKKAISVVSQLVIRSNVDINTGHIKFKGDVIILGDVAEGLIVQAGGYVSISGSVLAGKIIGETGVQVKRGVIGGYVCAGGEVATYSKLLPQLEKLEKGLEGIRAAFYQIKNNPKFSTLDLKVKGDGQLIRLILEMRFPLVTKALQELNQMMPEGEEAKQQPLWQVIGLMTEKLVGLGPLKIAAIEELEKLEGLLAKIIEVIKESMDCKANVTAGYCQNAHIEATGKVLIGKQGLYHTKVYAGEEIIVEGFCRGGELSACTEILAKEIGSATGAQTLVGVSEQGEIKAEVIHPNVTLRFGTIINKNQEFRKYAALHCHQGIIKELF